MTFISFSISRSISVSYYLSLAFSLPISLYLSLSLWNFMVLRPISTDNSISEPKVRRNGTRPMQFGRTLCQLNSANWIVKFPINSSGPALVSIGARYYPAGRIINMSGSSCLTADIKPEPSQSGTCLFSIIWTSLSITWRIDGVRVLKLSCVEKYNEENLRI